MEVLKIFIIFMLCFSANVVNSMKAKRKVLLVSFDGFRWDYIDRFNTPNFKFLADTGVHAKLGVRTAFVTKTFPDHYTIATGLYEETHGIVDNGMYDPIFNEMFGMSTTDPKWWEWGEPIWTTATLQGLATATYFWPGSDVKIKGVYPSFYRKYNSKIPFQERIDTIIEWLTKYDADFATLYFNEPDSTGHTFGTTSSDIQKSVEQADSTLGYLLHKMLISFLLNRIDLIIISDHGMTDIIDDKKDQHLIVLEDYLDLETEIKLVPKAGCVAGILPVDGMLDVVYNKLKNAHPNMTVYRREDIPERFHYKENRRIMPIVAIADEGYLISKKWRSFSIPGQHGYDNQLRSMHPIFFAHGPDFKQNYVVEQPFDTVDVYPLLCHLLGITPAPNEGSLHKIQHILVPSSQPNKLWEPTVLRAQLFKELRKFRQG